MLSTVYITMRVGKPSSHNLLMQEYYENKWQVGSVKESVSLTCFDPPLAVLLLSVISLDVDRAQ